MEIVVVWVVLAILCGVFAVSRGRSGGGFFLLSLVASPLLSFVVLLVIKDLSAEDEKIKQRAAEEVELEARRKQEHETRLAEIKALQHGSTAPPHASVSLEIERLAALLDRGLLTQEEFNAQKARLLGAA